MGCGVNGLPQTKEMLLRSRRGRNQAAQRPRAVRPGQDPFRVSRRAGRARRGAPFVPDALTGILVYFRGSSELFGGSNIEMGMIYSPRMSR